MVASPKDTFRKCSIFNSRVVENSEIVNSQIFLKITIMMSVS